MSTAPTWSHDVQRHDTGDTVVVLTGELDMAVSEPLRDVLLEEIGRTGTTRVTADLSAVTFLDSTALSSLLAAHTAAAERGITFTVTRPGRAVRRVLEITGLYGLFTAP